MLSLLNAICAKFTSDAVLSSAFPGGYHRDQAPESTVMPYLVSKVLQSNVEYSYGGACRSQTQIRFSAFGVGHDAVGSLMGTLTSRFDDVLLTLSLGSNDSVTRIDEPLAVLLRHDALGNDVWEWSVSYEYGVKV